MFASKPSAHTYRLYIFKEPIFKQGRNIDSATAFEHTGTMPCISVTDLLVAGIGFEPMTFGL